MQSKVVIVLENPNALIAMAHVSQNANNPFYTFCEYIKYCIFVNSSDTMTIEEIRDAVGLEFGIYLPRNIALKCISLLLSQEAISSHNHQIMRTGVFDTNAFDEYRTKYRLTEDALIKSLINYVAAYGMTWDESYAREILIDVLDRSGLAYDVFIRNSAINQQLPYNQNTSDFETFSPDYEDENVDTDGQPLFTDSFFVGRFINSILTSDSIQKVIFPKMRKCVYMQQA